MESRELPLSIRGDILFTQSLHFGRCLLLIPGIIFYPVLLISSRNNLLIWKKILAKAHQRFLLKESMPPFLGIYSTFPVDAFNEFLSPTLDVEVHYIRASNSKIFPLFVFLIDICGNRLLVYFVHSPAIFCMMQVYRCTFWCSTT